MQNIKSRSFYCRRSSKTDVLARNFAEFHLSSSTYLPVWRWPTSVTSNRTGAWTSWTVFSPPSRTLKGEFYANDLGPLFLKEVFSIEILYLSFWIRTSPYFPSTVMKLVLNLISSRVRFVYSAADDKVFGQLAKCPDSKKHPHAARWFRHIQSWKDGGDGSAVAKKGSETDHGDNIPESCGGPAVSTQNLLQIECVCSMFCMDQMPFLAR